MALAAIQIDDLMAQSGVGFGTSGARGLVSAMTDRVCYAYTVGFLSYLKDHFGLAAGTAVAVAGDLRPSTGRIMAACVQAIADSGFEPIHCGRIPTPALAGFAFAERMPSLMVTGSHIPDDRNGIKFNLPDRELLKSDEPPLRAQRVILAEGVFDDSGALRAPAPLPPIDMRARQDYVARYLAAFAPDCLVGTRVLVYEHSSVARDLLAEIPAALGAEVIRLGRADDFIPVDTEAIRPEDIELGRSWGAEHRFDIALSADGDGDRPLIGDENGQWLRGDLTGILTAAYLEADQVVTPVSSNTALECCGWFAGTRRTRIGSPYVIEGMQAAAEAGGRRVVGYEANGGFLINQALPMPDGELAPLPTRDAMIVGLAMLLSARRHGCKVSELSALLPSRFTASERLKAFPSAKSRARIAQLRAGGAEAIETLFGGLGQVRALDETDGLRITFDNEEIVHLRPSGNAPELRCYNEADSLERAEALNRECLARLAAWRDT